jgi:hypothetical protein
VPTSVFCIAVDDAQAERIVSELRSEGFSADDISVLLPDQHGTRDFAHEHHSKAPEGATTGAVSGGVLGGALGWLVGAGSFAIPGLGPFIAAGPILAMLGGAALLATAGGIAGALIGLGIPELEAKRYEGKIASGNILLSVHAHDSDDKVRAKEIFAAAGAEDIASSSESLPPRPARKR